MISKKLTILHTESSCGWGGQEIRILTEGHGMLQRGHRMILIADPKSKIYALGPEYGFETIGLPIERKRVAGLHAMRNWLKKYGHEVDVINTHSSTDAWLVAVACASMSGMPPMVRTRHVSTRVDNRFTTRWLYERASSHIVTTGEKLRQQLHRENGFPLSRMTSVRTGINLQRYFPRDKAKMRLALGVADKPTLGIVATLRSWKGHRYLLEAWVELSKRHPDWQLLIVGDGPGRKSLEELVLSLDMSNSVCFTGNKDDVEKWMACMDVFVLPSYGNEGVPQGIMQAMACGLPIVSTTVGAIEEAVQDAITGYMVEPKSVNALIDSISILMIDESLRLQFGRAGQEWSESNFSLENMIDAMEAIFVRMANGAL